MAPLEEKPLPTDLLAPFKPGREAPMDAQTRETRAFANMKAFLDGRSVAVFGATETLDAESKKKLGQVIAENLTATFRGDVYPINPKADRICGKKAYKNLAHRGIMWVKSWVLMDGILDNTRGSLGLTGRENLSRFGYGKIALQSVAARRLSHSAVSNSRADQTA